MPTAKHQTKCRPCQARSPCYCPGHPPHPVKLALLVTCQAASVQASVKWEIRHHSAVALGRSEGVLSEEQGPQQHGEGTKVMATHAGCGTQGSAPSGTQPCAQKARPPNTGPGSSGGLIHGQVKLWFVKRFQDTMILWDTKENLPVTTGLPCDHPTWRVRWSCQLLPAGGCSAPFWGFGTFLCPQLPCPAALGHPVASVAVWDTAVSSLHAPVVAL